MIENKIEIKEKGIYRGREYVIVFFRGHFNAYGETLLKQHYSEKIQFYSLDENSIFETKMLKAPEDFIEAHGGITFGASTLKHFDSDKLNTTKLFYGIDFAHFGDFNERLPQFGGKVWKQEEVKEEVFRLIDGILLYESEVAVYEINEFHNIVKTY